MIMGSKKNKAQIYTCQFAVIVIKSMQFVNRLKTSD